MKLVINLMILLLTTACHSESTTQVKETPTAAATPEGDYVSREAMTGTDKVSFNYFAVQQEKESGRYWFSLGGVKRYVENGEIISSFSAYGLYSFTNIVVVTDKGIYRQQLKEEDVAQECYSDEPEDGYLRCAERAYFTFNKPNERPMMILTSVGEKEIAFKPIEGEKIAPEETIELVEKNLNEDIACRNVGEKYDVKAREKYWKVDCYRWIKNKESTYVLSYGNGKGRESLFLQGEEGNRSFKSSSRSLHITKPCSGGIKYKNIKILNCWGDRFNRSGSYTLIDDKFVEIRQFEYHSVEKFFLGELSVGTDEYIVLWGDATHNYSSESKQLFLLQIRDSKLYKIDPVTQGYSTFFIR